MAELTIKGFSEVMAAIKRVTPKDPKGGAPKVTSQELNDAQCTVIAEKGQFKTSAYRRASTHDRAWDELFKKYPSLRSAFSHISSTFWTWNTAAVSVFAPSIFNVKTRVKARNLICLRDMTYGAKNTCWTGKPTPGQLAAVEAVAKSKNPTVLKYMAAYFSMASKKPLELFSNMERLVARNNDELLSDLKALADNKLLAYERAASKASKMADRGVSIDTIIQLAEAEATLNIFKQHLEQAVSEMPDRGVSVNAAAQLAAAAFNKAAEIGCSHADAQALNKKGNLWLKITRRLAHGSEALYWQQSKGTMQDPLFVARTTSALWCAAQIIPPSVARALNYFNVQGTRGAHLSGVSLAFLMSAMTAADKVMAACGKVVTPPVHSGRRPVVITCKDPNMIIIDKKCVCKNGWKLNQLTKKCYKDGGDPPPPPPCTGGRIRINGECKCPRGLEWIRNRCRRRQQACTGGRIRIDGRCKCPRGLEWIRNRCRRRQEACTGGRIRVDGRCKCPRGTEWINNRCKKPPEPPMRTVMIPNPFADD